MWCGYLLGVGEQADGSRPISEGDESAPTELDDEAVRQLRRAGLQGGVDRSPQGRHEAADHDFDSWGEPIPSAGGPAWHEVPEVRLPDQGPLTGDPDPIEGSGR